MNNKRQNGQVYKLIFFVCLTLFGLVWLFVDMNTDKKSFTEIMDDFDRVTQESTINTSQEANPDEQETDNSKENSNEYDSYSVDELPEGQTEETTPELYDENN